MKIEQIQVTELNPYKNNSRTHSPEQIAQIAASITEFGFTNPVLIDNTGEIIAGHGRVEAAKTLGLKAVPCVRLSHLSDTQKRAYIIADNRLSELSGWDQELLTSELLSLEKIDLIEDIFAGMLPTKEQKEQLAADIKALEIETETDEKITDEQYDKIMTDKNAAGKLPIVPRYLENHTAFIIVCDNAIDEAFIRQRLGLNTPAQSYKDKKICIPNIISVDQLRKIIT